MAKVCVSESLAALADVADAVGKLRRALPEDWCLHQLADEVKRIGSLILEERMEPEEAEESLPLQPAPKRPRAAAAKEPEARRSKKPEAPAGEVKRPAQTMGVCVVCGASYLCKGPAQKTCSPACLELKRQNAASSQPAEGESEPKNRLERIKQIDRKLDTIPDATGV